MARPSAEEITVFCGGHPRVATPRARGISVSLILWALIGATASANVEVQTPVDLARQYFVRWQKELAAIVAEEHLSQTITSSRERHDSVRTIVSDVLVVYSPGDDAWLMFRDVISVDGQVVRDRQERFAALFMHPEIDVLPNARRIAEESARYNAGLLLRTINTPLAPLALLNRKYSASTRWKLSEVTVSGKRLVELAFEQDKAPFAFQKPNGKAQPVEGKIWCEPGTGAIVSAELSMIDRVMSGEGFTSGISTTSTRVTATYGAVTDLSPWVPLQMDERIELHVVQPQLAAARGALVERMVGTAVYTNYRQFQTGGRIIG